MEIYFANKTTTIPGLYEGFEDIPGLALSFHLHAWRFATPLSGGEARFRVEIRQGSCDPHVPLVGSAFVRADQERILEVQGYAPLAQAVLEGVLTHEAVRLFVTRAAKEALTLPVEEEEKKSRIRVPLKELKNYKP